MANAERQQLLRALQLADADQNQAAVQEITSMLQEMDARPQGRVLDYLPEPTGQMYDPQQRGMQPGSGAALAKIGEGIQDVFGPEGIATTEGMQQRASQAKFGFAADPRMAMPLAVSRMMTAAGDALITGAKPFVAPVLSATGEALEPHVKRAVEPVVALGNILEESEAIGPLLELAGESWTSFTEELKNYPEEAKVLQALFDTATFASPATKMDSLIDSGSELENVGMDLVRSGRRKVSKDRKQAVKTMLDPMNLHGKGRTTIEGPLGQKVYHPLAIEQEGIDVLASLDSIKPNAPFTTNYNTVMDEIGNTRRRLDERIRKAGNPEVSMDTVIAELNKNAKRALEHPQIIGNVEQSLQKILAETARQLEKSDGTALGLLNARRNIDNWIASSRGNAFDSEFENAITAGRRVVADTLNGIVSEAVPRANVDQLLRKQMLMYQAGGVIEQKALYEANTRLGRAMQRVEGVTGAKFPVTPLAMAATGGAGASLMASGFAPYVGLSMILPASGYGLTKLAMSPTTRKALGQLLVGIGKAEKAAKGNAQLLADLKLDRAVVSALLTDLRPAPEEEEE